MREQEFILVVFWNIPGQPQKKERFWGKSKEAAEERKQSYWDRHPSYTVDREYWE